MKILVSILFSLFFVVACDRASNVQKKLQTEDSDDIFVQCLRNRDFVCINEIIYLVSTKQDRNAFSRMLYKFWMKDCTLLNNENCELLENVDVRLSVASYLSQEVKNGFLNGEVHEYNDYAIDVFLHSENVDLKAKAVRLLGVIGLLDNLSYIENALMSNDKLLSESGGLAFSMSCYVGESDFKKMLKKITDDNLRASFEDKWNVMRSIREFCKK